MAKKRDRLTTKDRKFSIVLYPDATNYDCQYALSQLELIEEYAYVLHDKDELIDKETGDRTGELEKPHYQCAVRFNTPRLISSVCSKLGLPSDYQDVQFCDSFDALLKYTAHRTRESAWKWQYSREEVHTNIPSYFTLVGFDSESLLMCRLFDLLDQGYSVGRLARYVAERESPAMYSVLRRNFSILSAYSSETRIESYVKRNKDSSVVSVNMDIVNSLLSKE